MNVCVFCGSRPGVDPAYTRLADALGRELGASGHRLVYGGASVGLMGTVADACLDAGGEVIGIIPRSLVDREVAHAGLTEQVEVGSLAERKTKMVERSDAFVTIPGGIGTLDELFEVWTMGYLGLHDRPVLVLDDNGYYRSLLEFLDRSVQQGFLGDAARHQLEVFATVEDLLDRLSDRSTAG